MKNNKRLIVLAIRAALLVSMTSVAYAGDVEVHLPAATDAMTVDQPAGTELMRVNGDGAVGIGTATPVERLHVNTGNVLVQNGRPLLRISDDSGAADNKNFQLQNVDGSLYFGSADDSWAWDHPGTYSLVLHNNGDAFFNTGNVGIGTVAPSTALDIKGSENAFITLQDGDAVKDEPGHHAGIRLKDGNNQQTGFIGYSTSVEGISIQSLNDDGGIHLSTGGNANQVVVGADGNVGIGTANPIHDLHLQGDGSQHIGISATGASQYAGVLLDANARSWSVRNRADLAGGFSIADETALKNRLVIDPDGDVGVGINAPARKLHVVGNNFPLRIERDGIDAWDFSIDGNRLSFFNPGVNHYPLVLNKMGQVGINVPAPAHALHVSGSVNFGGLSAGAAGDYLCRDTNGLITHGASCSTSDRRLKKAVKPVEHALAKVAQLQGVTYKWKDEARGKRTELGLIAQDVEKVVPEVVDTAADEMGTRSIRYEDLVALLIESTKEQQAQIAAQQQRIEALEAKLK